MRRPNFLKVLVLVALLVLALPHAATAQTASAPAPVSLKLPPGITISGSGGIVQGRLQSNGTIPVFSGSMEIAMNRFMLAQIEATSGRWDYEHTSHGSAFTLGGAGYTGDYVESGSQRRTDLVGNFLGRAGAHRVHVLFGAGFGLGFTSRQFTSAVVGCIPTPLVRCQTSGQVPRNSVDFVQQLVAGTDVRLTEHITAFATFRLRTLEETERTVLGGLRATIRRAPVSVAFSGAQGLVTPAAATGKEVHVVALDYSRHTGRLVSIDDRQVTISRRDGQVSIPLKTVQGVRLVSHAVRKGTFIGFGAGFGTGFLFSLLTAESDPADYAFEGGLFFGALGAGAGAAIGAAVNLSGAASRTIYVGPAKAALNLAPAMGKGRIGFRGLLSW
jgi:hypothetical protein